MPSTNAPLESQRVSTRAIPPSGSLAGAPRDHGVGNTVIPIFLLAVIIPLRGLHTVIPGFPDLPINTMAAILLAALALFVRPQWLISIPGFTILSAALWITLIFPSAIYQEDFDLRRAGSLTALFAVAAVVAGGRVHLDSLRRGMMVGLVVGVAAGIVQMQNATNYFGRLAGVLGDPNGVGFTVVSLGFVIAQRTQNRFHLALLYLFMSGTIWLTQSRTTMFAFAVGTLWVLVGRRIGRVIGITALAGVTWFFQWISAYAERQGWFVERLGSDNLRDRLAETEQILTDSAGWWGNGLGTAVAEFDGISLFFHNSYRALQAEGGLIAIILLILMGASLYWSFHALPADRRPLWGEAALIAACICSFNIGYSITSVPMAITVGAYIGYHCLAREQLKVEQLEAGAARS